MVFCTWTQFPKRKREERTTQIHLLFCTQTHSTKETKERGKIKNPRKGPKSTFIFGHKHTPQKREKKKKGKKEKKKKRTQSTQTYRPKKKEKEK